MNHFLNNFKKLLLILGDLIIMFGSLWLALVVRHGANYSIQTWQSHWQIFGILYLIWLPIYFAFNLYDLKVNLYVIPLISNLLRATAVTTIISIIYFYIISTDIFITPKTILAINIVFLTIFLFLWRRIFYSLIKTQALENNLIFIGWDPIINEIIKQNSTESYKPLGIFDESIINNTNCSLPIYNNFDQLTKVIKEKKVNLIVLGNNVNDSVTNKLFNNLTLRLNFISLSKFYEEIFQKIPLSIINQNWFLENLSEGNKGPFELYKRIFDILISIIIGIISLPFIPFIIFVIKVDSKGPILFTQTRTGKDGKTFTAIKFRTMHLNAEKNGPEWAKKDDPRVTKIGKFFRKTRIDEIPQFLNILKGDMSLVGPRPERPFFVEQLKKEIPYYSRRLRVRPGITGWAQIKHVYDSSLDDVRKKLQYDLYYIENMSLRMDLKIIFNTIYTVLAGKGH